MPQDPNLTRTQQPSPPTGAYDTALDAGLAAAFGPDATPGGWSQPPLLRDDPSEHAPLVQPSSAEMPRGTGVRYQLLGEIARGGMGVVLKGRDPDLGRDLAFKVLRQELSGKPAAVQRFVEEAQVGGQLQHPGIVPIYDIGRFGDGRPYFATKLVKGRTLADLLAERTDPTADRGRYLRHFLQVCNTLAYAHSKGVLHRDMKPSNVMVGAFDEVLVMDWGLAKVLARGGVADEAKASRASEPAEVLTEIKTARFGSGSETEAGSVMGTPAFMPPEQAGGEIDKLDERADVFGLGAVLCVILTGKPPYVAESGDVRLMAVRGQLDDCFARLDACGADAELVAICKRSLSVNRDTRPRDAAELAAAVSAYLAGVETRARQAELEGAAAVVRAGEERKRRKVKAALGLSFTALLALGGLSLWWSDRQAAERESRRQRTADSVSIALDDAGERAGEAWGLTEEPDKMRIATDHALAAVRRAEGFARSGEASAEITVQLDSVRRATDDLDRHNRLLEDLDEILSGHDVAGDGDARTDTGTRIGVAFRAFGWDPSKTSTGLMADEVVASRIRNKALGLLRNWEFQSRNVAERNSVREVIRLARLKSGGVLARWQTALDRADAVELFAVADDPQTLQLGPELVLSLCGDLRDAGYPDREVVLLRRSQGRYPKHIWINFVLMEACLKRKPPLTGEVVRCAAAAATARPGNALLQINLGRALANAGSQDAAAAAYREAIRLVPNYARAHANLGLALQRLGDLDGAIGCCREAVRLSPKMAPAFANLGIGLARAGRSSEALRITLFALREYPAGADNPGNGLLYNAGCFALNCADGKGVDAPPPADRPAYRKRALDHLATDLAACRKLAPASRAFIHLRMRHWLADDDLESVRGQTAIEKMPLDEQVAWVKLWTEVRALRDATAPLEMSPPPRETNP